MEDNLVRRNLARIENKASPPLIPAPIEKPFADAVTTRVSFSESWNGFKPVPDKQEEEEKGGSDFKQCVFI